MKLTWKALVSILLVFVIMFAMVGCSGDDEDYDYDMNDYEDDAAYSDGQDDFALSGEGFSPNSAAQLSFTPIASGFTKTDPNIETIEINQGISYGVDANKNLYLINSFVAERDTVIYTTFSEAVNVTNDGSYLLNVYRNGELVSSLLPQPENGAKEICFYTKNLSDFGGWQEGAYTFEVITPNGDAKRDTNFYTARKLRVLAVPMVNNYSGSILGCAGEWKTSANHLYATYPLAKDGIDYILGAELDLSGAEYDLNNDDGMYNVWIALSNLQQKTNGYDLIIGFAAKAQGNGSVMGYTYMAPAVIVSENSTDREATVSHEIAHTFGIGDEYPEGSLYPPVNMPPYGMSGRNMVTEETATGTNPNILGGESVGLEESGSVIYEEQRAYNVKTNQSLGRVTSYMGWATSGGSYSLWVTGDIWNHMFKVLTGITPTGLYLEAGKVVDIGTIGYTSSATGGDGDYTSYDENSGDGGWGSCPECYEEMEPIGFYGECTECYALTALEDYEGFACEECGEFSEFDPECLVVECGNCEELSYYASIVGQASYKRSAQTTAAKAQDLQVVQILGTLYKDGRFTPRPWYSFEADRSVLSSSTKGDFAAVVYDKDGKPLVTVGFKASFVTNSNPPREVDRIPIDLTLPLPPAASKIAIMQGDKELYARAVSGNMPVVEFTGLSDYQQLQNTATITWKGSDADGDKLYYELWYCPNEEESFLVATDIEDTTYNVNLSGLPGSNEGYFYLYATDGVKAGEASSPYIKVDYKVPEILTASTKPLEYKITEEIWYDTEAYDMQDGWLYDDEIVWHLDGKEYDTGAGLLIWPYELKPGVHDFTMTVTNSAGLTASQVYQVKIIDDGSDLPTDWSRSDVKQALSDGFMVNLKAIDAPVSRKKVAEIMGLLYIYMNEDDSYSKILDEYTEGQITDCGDDDFDPWFAVKLGIMDAPGGQFKPYGNVTEKEFAEIMYKTLYKADPEYFENLTQIDEILEAYYEFGALDDAENNYSADSNLTAKKMLVQINRLLRGILE